MSCGVGKQWQLSKTETNSQTWRDEAAPSASNKEHRYHTVKPRLQLHRVYLTTLDAAKSSISFYIKRKLIMERNE